MSCSQSPQRWSERESGAGVRVGGREMGGRGRQEGEGPPAGEGRRPGLQGDLSVCEVCAVGISASSGHPLAALPCLRVLLHSSSLCPARASAQPAKGPRCFLPLLLLWSPGTALPGPLFLRLASGVSASCLSHTYFKLVSSSHVCLPSPTQHLSG